MNVCGYLADLGMLAIYYQSVVRMFSLHFDPSVFISCSGVFLSRRLDLARVGSLLPSLTQMPGCVFSLYDRINLTGAKVPKKKKRD